MIKQLEVDDGFTEIDIKISGKKFYAIVDSLVKIENAKLGDISIEEVENQLELSASYQVNFAGALGEVKRKLNQFELEYKIWYAKQADKAKKKYIGDLLVMVDEGKITKGNVKIPSKGEIEDYIILAEEDIFKKFNENINELRINAETVNDYLTILRNRGNDLRALLKQERNTENNSSTVIKETQL
jgi:hypothetical protein